MMMTMMMMMMMMMMMVMMGPGKHKCGQGDTHVAWVIGIWPSNIHMSQIAASAICILGSNMWILVSTISILA
eukprot:1585194-Karenia_brevis.AAC.1